MTRTRSNPNAKKRVQNFAPSSPVIDGAEVRRQYAVVYICDLRRAASISRPLIAGL